MKNKWYENNPRYSEYLEQSSPSYSGYADDRSLVDNSSGPIYTALDTPDGGLIEELDAPPTPPGKGLSFKRELLLGALVLACLLGLVFWQWSHQESAQQSYSLAREALSQHDLDKAHAYYVAASGVRDADAQATALARQIDERDRQYQAAVSAAKQGNWAAALQEVAAVQDIQPNYRNTVWLAAQVTDHVLRDALNGTVVQRTQGDEPGLYYRDWDSWLRLPESDQWSSVLGSGSPGRFIYDVPGPHWNPDRTGLPGRNDVVMIPGSPRMQGRNLMMASYQGGRLTTAHLSLDPAEYNSYVWGEHGVWALRYKYSYAPSRATPLLSGFLNYDITYQSFDQPAVAVHITLPGPQWTVIDLARDGSHMLLSDTGPVSALGLTSHLYLAQGDGTRLHLLYSQPAGFVRAQFSPDSRYVLVSTYSSMAAMRGDDQVVAVVDTQAGGSAEILSHLSLPDSGSSRMEAFKQSSPEVSAGFMTQGKMAGKVLVTQWDVDGSTFTLFDPAAPSKPLAFAEVPGSPVGQVWSAYDGGSDLVLAWQNSSGNSLPSDAVTLVHLSLTGASSWNKLDLGGSERLSGVWLRDGQLLYATRSYAATYTDASSFIVSAVPMERLGGKQARATVLYRGYTAYVDPFATTSLWNLGSRLLAYTKDGHLHIRTLDGSIDLPIGSDVQSFYDPSSSTVREPR